MNLLSNLRRFLMYGIGFIVGYLIYLGINAGKGDRVSWLPGAQILNQLKNKELIFTEQVKKQMSCYTISTAEINELLKTGEVNYDKSKIRDIEAGKYPNYAIELNTKDGQHIRVHFLDCDTIVKVVNAIDLKSEYKCE